MHQMLKRNGPRYKTRSITIKLGSLGKLSGIFIALWLVNLTGLGAQSFQYNADLPAIDSSGFYQVQVPPEIGLLAGEGYEDIRLYSKQGRETPYLLKQEKPVSREKRFKTYSVLNKTYESGCCTRIIIENPRKKDINNLSLLVKNARIRKTASLSGSNDREQWFAIDNEFNLQNLYSDTGTTEVKILDFPQTDYKYYRLTIRDSNANPLNIRKVGYYDHEAQRGQYFNLPTPSISQIDSTNGSTYLAIHFEQPYHINRLNFQVTDPVYYHRQARIIDQKTNKRLKRFVLSSKQTPEVSFHQVKSDSLLIIIENQDNPPLVIDEVEADQLKHSLIAYLEGGKAYEIRLGNEKLGRPAYDLQHFEDSIPNRLTTLSPESPNPIEKKRKGKNKPDSFFESKLWLWVPLGIVIALLGFLSIRMVRQME